jgi:hypothetical protein
VWCSNEGRRYNVPFTIIPDFGKVTEDGFKVSRANKTWDVLQECVSGSYFANDSDGIRPQISFIGIPFPLSSHREGLAGESPRDNIHSSTPLCTIECSDIIPDRSIFKQSVLDASDKNRLAVRVVFDIATGSIPWDRMPEGK